MVSLKVNALVFLLFVSSVQSIGMNKAVLRTVQLARHLNPYAIANKLGMGDTLVGAANILIPGSGSILKAADFASGKFETFLSNRIVQTNVPSISGYTTTSPHSYQSPQSLGLQMQMPVLQQYENKYISDSNNDVDRFQYNRLMATDQIQQQGPNIYYDNQPNLNPDILPQVNSRYVDTSGSITAKQPFSNVPSYSTKFSDVGYNRISAQTQSFGDSQYPSLNEHPSSHFTNPQPAIVKDFPQAQQPQLTNPLQPMPFSSIPLNTTG